MSAHIATERTDWFVTASGRRLFLLDPDPEQIVIEDIALHLSQVNRFGGMTRVPYSVAQHSVMVSHLVPGGMELAALLHDATEAYLGDVISPLKRLLPDYGAIEKRWVAAICERFGLELHTVDGYLFALPEIKHADIRALLTERHYLVEPHEWLWVEDSQKYELAPWSDPLSPVEARDAFLARFKEVSGG